MSFLTPLYLAGAALIAIPIVLHLLRRDVAPPVSFTAVSLLRKTAVDRSRRHRVRDLLLLAARVCALVLLAASFARPYRARAPAAGGTTVIAVDRSFSMAAPGRADRARTLAREAADAAAGGNRVAVIAFDDRAVVVSPAGTAADARAAIARIAPGYGSTRYAAAFDKAAELLVNEARGRLVVVTDLQRSGFEAAGASLPEGIELVVRDAGAPISNLSVTNATIDAARRVLTATVRNDGEMPRSAQVHALVGDRALPARQVTVAAGDAVDVPFAAAADPRSVKISIDDPAGYAADNDWYGVFEARALPRVLVVGGAPGSTAGFYVSRALQADAGEGADFEVRTMAGGAFAALPAADVREQSAIMLLSTHGLDRRAGDTLRGFVAAGGGLFVAAGPDVDAAVLSTLLQWQPALLLRDAAREPQRARVLAATDLRHPVFRPFDAVAANFGQVLFDRAWDLDASSAWRVAARFTDGTPALVERAAAPPPASAAAPGHVLLFTSDVDRRWNDFPLHPTFVPFVQEIARYLGAHPAAVSAFMVSDPPAGMPAVPGFARVGTRTVAVNVDPRESRVDRLNAAEFQKMVARSTGAAQARGQRLARDTEGQQNYWRYGLMLLLATLVVEAFVGSR
jgi:hypothetical protein